MTPDLNAIKARADRATKGPWHAEYFGDNGYPQRVCNDAAMNIADTSWGGGGLAPDAEFIAHAREDVPALLAEIDRLTAELTVVRRERAWLLDGLSRAELEEFRLLAQTAERAREDAAEATQHQHQPHPWGDPSHWCDGSGEAGHG